MRTRRPIDRMIALEITPMIDVVFLLIIFFMTTAQFVRLTREKMELPLEPGEQERVPEEAGMLVNIMADGRIIVAREELTLDDLEAMVRDEIDRDAAGFKLMIRADRNTSSTSLNQVVTRLQVIGVGAARLATEIP